jgi:tetratricopeptide (TPR) repeat protein
LLASLLEASGYHASSVLMSSNRKIDPDVPSPAQFDHVISLVPLPKEEVWMDSTAEVAPFRMLSPQIRKKQGLVIPQQGTPHLEESPADPPTPNREFQAIDGKVNEFGKLTAHVKMTMRGDSELFIRQLFRRVPNSDWQRLVTRIAALSGLQGDVTDVKVGDPAETRNPFEFEYQIVVNNFYDWAKKKSAIALPLSQITLVDANEDNTDATSDKIEFGSPTEYVFDTKLEFPAKYNIRAPLPFSMKRDYAQYDAAYRVDGTVFASERKLSTLVRDLPAARASDYAAFRRAVFSDVAQRLSVDSTGAAIPTASADLKGDDLDDAANAALQRNDSQTAVDLYKRLLDADPKRKNGWISLGRAYMGLRDTDHAIEAFRKQADMNAYDEYAFNSLGWAYTTARRYDEAAAAYQKAIEINPLNQYAHGALGGMYSENHQYEKAVPELEKAVSLSPNDAFLEINMGDAYLNVGQDDKALAAFDKAIEISASPGVYNNIAYQLSLKNAHLDLAQQYAESAVAAIVAASRNLTLDQLSERDLAISPSLAAYWDTLGWVYFGRGNLAQAEKYIQAAWSLDQHSDVADHLGQIYEKQGRKDDALHAYGMAVAAPNPSPEAKARLLTVAGSDKRAKDAQMKGGEDSSAVRLITMPKVAGKQGTAEFFLVFSNSTSGAHVDGVKFISGDDSLKLYSEALRTAKYPVIFPDDSPARVLRRGSLTCMPTATTCSFVLFLPQDVRSVN